MAGFVSGEVIVLPFPFMDLKSTKVRPALVLATLSRDDFILCQITSQAYSHPEAISLERVDFATGGLPKTSYAIPHRIVTANQDCALRSVGRITPTKLNLIRECVCSIIRQP